MVGKPWHCQCIQYLLRRK